jgi:hypothetical protein
MEAFDVDVKNGKQTAFHAVGVAQGVLQMLDKQGPVGEARRGHHGVRRG